jgi:copper chaperone CopZ
MTTHLKVEGMSCGNCVKHVKTTLEEMEGVQSASVDLDAATADVEHAETVSVAAMTAALDEEGYEATV